MSDANQPEARARVLAALQLLVEQSCDRPAADERCRVSAAEDTMTTLFKVKPHWRTHCGA